MLFLLALLYAGGCGEPKCPDDSVYVEERGLCVRPDGGMGDGGEPGDRDGCVELTFHADLDEDEFGDPEATVRSCSAPPGYVSDGTDCDDSCSDCNPTATEICDALDNDCDEDVDEEVSRSCGTTVEGACELGTEICSEGVWGACEGAVEPVDESCEGRADENCNGTVDEGCSCSSSMTRSCGTDEGACVSGTQACEGGSWGACEGAVSPTAEVCDGLDNDCDGEEDEGLTIITCYRDVDGDTYGVMAVSMESCACPAGWTDRADAFDCHDGSDDAFPGQTAYFGTGLRPYGCTVCERDFFDFNCDGTEEKRWTGVWDGSPVCAGGGGVCIGGVWSESSGVPDCGAAGGFWRCGSGCSEMLVSRLQECH